MKLSTPPRNTRILVIDDNKSIHEDIRKILRCHERDAALRHVSAELFGGPLPCPSALNYQVEGAVQGEEALRMIEAAAAAGQPYAMAFVDVRMPPGWDGIETVSRIWSRRPDLQVVLCTAYSDYSWEDMMRALGRSDNLLILKKPFDKIEVLQLANALTEKWSLNHQVTCRLRDLDQLAAQRTQELQLANEQVKKDAVEQLKLEIQLRQAQKMEAVGQLAAGVAHDFNNILTIVQGNASLVLAGLAPGSADRPQLQNICAAAERAAKTVGQLLAFCRKQDIALRPTNLRDIVTAIAERSPRFLGTGIKIEAQPAPGLPLINGDGPMLEQALTNLVLNACDAMPQGGLLSLAAAPVTLGQAEAASHSGARAGHFVRLSVLDTGVGIPSEILPRIFDPFFTTKPIGKGPGLGLAAVHGIVQQHQGWVEVQSQANRGTAIHIFLPALGVSEPRQTSPAVSGGNTAGAHETILVVDDEPDLRELVAQVLESGGYKVISAGSGAEALQLWARRRGDIRLLLTDMALPDNLSGRKLAEQLRNEDPQLRVIYTSGYSAGQPGTELANVEARNFLAKPYRPTTLLRCVRDCLDRPCAPLTAARQAA